MNKLSKYARSLAATVALLVIGLVAMVVLALMAKLAAMYGAVMAAVTVFGGMWAMVHWEMKNGGLFK